MLVSSLQGAYATPTRSFMTAQLKIVCNFVRVLGIVFSRKQFSVTWVLCFLGMIISSSYLADSYKLNKQIHKILLGKETNVLVIRSVIKKIQKTLFGVRNQGVY